METIRLTRKQVEEMIYQYYDDRGVDVKEIFSHTGGYTIVIEKKEE